MSRMETYKDFEKKFHEFKETENTKLDELTGLRFKLFMYLTKCFTKRNHDLFKSQLFVAKSITQNEKQEVYDLVLQHLIDNGNISKHFLNKDNTLNENGKIHYQTMFQTAEMIFAKYTNLTKFKIICNRFPEYKPNHINNELKKLIKLGLVGKDTTDNNFKNVYYYSILDEDEFAISFIKYIGSIRSDKTKIHNYTNFELERVRRLFEINAMLFDNINIENLREFYGDVLIPSILADKSYKYKEEFRFFGNYFEDDKLINYIKDIVQDRQKTINRIIKLSQRERDDFHE
jgi:hypothetical protein